MHTTRAPRPVETWLLGQIPDTPASLRFLGAICGGKSHVVSRGDPRLGIVRAVEMSEDDVGGFGLGYPGIQKSDESEGHQTADDWAHMKLGTDDGAIPAKVSENIRPTVIAGLAKLVELVKK